MESHIRTIHQQLINREITCTKLVQERLELLKLNTHVTVNSLLEASALESASKVDAKIKSGQEIGLLEGIPFGINSNMSIQF